MLKTNNYLDKRYDETKTVVAVVQVDTKMGVATFNIASSREKALAGNIIEQKKIYMTFDRNENPYVQAYKKATTPEIIKECNPETGLEEEIEVKPFFYGWENVIVV